MEVYIVSALNKPIAYKIFKLLIYLHITGPDQTLDYGKH